MDEVEMLWWDEQDRLREANPRLATLHDRLAKKYETYVVSDLFIPFSGHAMTAMRVTLKKYTKEYENA